MSGILEGKVLVDGSVNEDKLAAEVVDKINNGGGTETDPVFTAWKDDYMFAAGMESSATGGASVGIGYQSTASGNYSVSIGGETQASGESSAAVGPYALAEADRAVALGAEVFAGGSYGVAMGSVASANAEHSVAIGSWASVSGNSSLSIGSDIMVNGEKNIGIGSELISQGSYNSIAIGPQTFVSNVSAGTAIGMNAQVFNTTDAIAIGTDTLVTGDYAMVMGYKAASDYADTVALGKYAKTNAIKSVSLGGNSSASESLSTALGWASRADAQNSVALGSDSVADASDTVSVGNSSRKRRIVNVSAGTDATDAATVGQLTDAIESITETDPVFTAWQDGDILLAGRDCFATGDNSVVFGTSAVCEHPGSVVLGERASSTQTYAISIGSESSCYGSGVAVGRMSSATGPNSVSLGACTVSMNTNTVAVGYQSSAKGIGNISLGSYSTVEDSDKLSTESNGVVSVGSTGSFTRRIINVEDGLNATDAATVGQLTDAIECITETDPVFTAWRDRHTIVAGANASVGQGGSCVVLGQRASSAEGGGAVAIGIDSKAQQQDSIAIGNNPTASGRNSIALGTSSMASGVNSIAIGTKSESTSDNVVSFGNSTLKRQLIYVEDGILDHHAATVGQLNAALDTIAALTTRIEALESSLGSSNDLLENRLNGN